uniref:C2H2-type domain-containing protein n=1 Tax=Glossina brevipalpis TaxID=37001 RepID=A0A1A9W1X4_9MUSC
MHVLQSQHFLDQANVTNSVGEREVENEIQEQAEIAAADEQKSNIIDARRGSLRSSQEGEGILLTSEDSGICSMGNLCGNSINDSNTCPAVPTIEITTQWSKMKIRLPDAPSDLKSAKICVEYTKTKESWMSSIYRSLENKFWYKTPREGSNKYNWYFNCDFCNKRYRTFAYLKGHLNRHLKYFPFKCKTCSESFPLRCLLTTHLRKAHRIKRADYHRYIAH